MEKELTIGILSLTPGWETVLNQTGVSYRETTPSETFSPERYSLLIITRAVTNMEFEQIESYIADGGAIIDTGFCIDRLDSGIISQKKIKSITINNGLPFNILCGAIDIYAKVTTFSKAQYLNRMLFIGNHGNGISSFFGINIDTLLFDMCSRPKEFYSALKRAPYEEVSCVSKGDITRLVFNLIKYLHIQRGIPFVHKWFFPDGKENVFLFRIDSDFGTQEQVKKWHDITEINKIRPTWFLHVAAHEKWLEIFSQFDGHEIAVHGYDHITSKKSTVIKQNIEKAQKILKDHDFQCYGHASPYGLWNTALNSICEESGFIYSSEFSYCYDSLPLHPVVKNRKSSVLQIPIHPICIGSLLNVKAQKEEINDYFAGIVNLQKLQYNPLVFYDHVLHEETDVLQEFFKNIETVSIPRLTFLEFANWWINREKSTFKAMYGSEDTLVISPSKKLDELFFCVWTKPDTYILTNDEVNHSISSQTGNKLDYSLSFDKNTFKRIRKFNLKIQKNAFINKMFWRKYR